MIKVKRYFVLSVLALYWGGGYCNEQNLKFGICETQSNCERCIESFSFTLVPDFPSRRVVAIGFDKGGKAIWREYKKCQMENSENWRCTGFHGDYVSRNGIVVLEENVRTYYPQRGLEICNFSE